MNELIAGIIGASVGGVLALSGSMVVADYQRRLQIRQDLARAYGEFFASFTRACHILRVTQDEAEAMKVVVDARAAAETLVLVDPDGRSAHRALDLTWKLIGRSGDAAPIQSRADVQRRSEACAQLGQLDTDAAVFRLDVRRRLSRPPAFFDWTLSSEPLRQ